MSSALTTLPADYFSAALALVQSKSDACRGGHNFITEFRDWFARECLAGGTPWTPAIQRELTKQRRQRVHLPARVDWLALANKKKAA